LVAGHVAPPVIRCDQQTNLCSPGLRRSGNVPPPGSAGDAMGRHRLPGTGRVRDLLGRQRQDGQRGRDRRRWRPGASLRRFVPGTACPCSPSSS